jgi:hypothetical protein
MTCVDLKSESFFILEFYLILCLHQGIVITTNSALGSADLFFKIISVMYLFGGSTSMKSNSEPYCNSNGFAGIL